MPKNSSSQSTQKQTNNYIAVLQSAGYRITAQRALICRYLATTERHPTPYQIYADVQALDPAISRATVYNTLNTLQQLGAIVEINFGANHTHYDTDPAPHINLICLRCHAIEDCHCALPVDGALQANIAHHDFQAVATKIDVLGLCKACRQATQT
jgi:Fe2+ or Zn2+ uptake regulation protein